MNLLESLKDLPVSGVVGCDPVLIGRDMDAVVYDEHQVPGGAGDVG